MKLGALIVALFAACGAPSAFAKGPDGHHAHHAGAAKAAPHRSSPASDNGGAATSAGDKSDKINVDGAAVPLPSRDNVRHVRLPKLQIVKPETGPAPHVGAVVPSKPPARNAIGQMSVGSVKTGGGLPDNVSAGEGGTPRQGGYAAAAIPHARPSVPPNTNGGIANRGKIDGSSLIRPVRAAAIGGPAKPAGGINGTLLPSKHK